MTHEEIVKELRNIREFLQSRAKDIKTRYGETPEFKNDTDKWHYKLLMQVCRTVQEPQSINYYIKVEVPDMNFARNSYGIDI